MRRWKGGGASGDTSSDTTDNKWIINNIRTLKCSSSEADLWSRVCEAFRPALSLSRWTSRPLTWTWSLRTFLHHSHKADQRAESAVTTRRFPNPSGFFIFPFSSCCGENCWDLTSACRFPRGGRCSRKPEAVRSEPAASRPQWRSTDALNESKLNLTH